MFNFITNEIVKPLSAIVASIFLAISLFFNPVKAEPECKPESVNVSTEEVQEPVVEKVQQPVEEVQEPVEKEPSIDEYMTDELRADLEQLTADLEGLDLTGEYDNHDSGINPSVFDFETPNVENSYVQQNTKQGFNKAVDSLPTWLKEEHAKYSVCMDGYPVHEVLQPETDTWAERDYDPNCEVDLFQQATPDYIRSLFIGGRYMSRRQFINYVKADFFSPRAEDASYTHTI